MVDANNLVSYPKSGTTLYNLTGSTGDSTLINGPTFDPSNGGSFFLDGTDDVIRVTGTQTALQTIGTGDFTMCLWVKIDTTQTGDEPKILFNNKNAPAAAAGYGFDYFYGGGNNGKLLWSTGNGSSAVEIFSQNSFTSILGNWAYLVMVRQNGATNNGHFYVNGVYEPLASSATVLNVNTATNMTLGNTADSYGSYFTRGNFANAKIYNRALSPSEVQQNYQATKDKFQGQQIVTNGLVLNLDAADKDSYPGTGTTWTDLSGNGNNGTLLNGVAFNANKNGGVMYFDDTDDTVSIGNSSLFSITNAMTVFAWVNPSSTSGWDGIFGGSISGFVHFQLYLGTINIYIYGPNASYSNNDSYNVPANAWISVGFTYDGTTLKVYVNGSQLATTIPGSGNVSSNSDVRVGWAYDTSRVFGGFIGTTQVYNRALSATEIAQNYNATKGRFGL
jgi:hypothetical protein